MNFGHLTVQYDPSTMGKRISYSLLGSAMLRQYVSNETLLAVPDKYALVRMVSDGFLRIIAKDIEEQLLAEFKSLGDTGMAGNQPKYGTPPISSGSDSVSIEGALKEAIPGLENAKVPNGCPACVNDQRQRHVTDAVIHLNDVHKWTREEIADWLDTLDCDLSFAPPEEM